jgi:hypothetical protein
MLNEKNEAATYCFAYRFGFQKKIALNQSVAYIKPEVINDIEQLEKLNDSLPIVTHNARFVNYQQFYDEVNALTPSACFQQCKLSVLCGAASFTTDIECPRNCFLYKRVTGFGQSLELTLGLSKWISYTKEQSQDSFIMSMMFPEPSVTLASVTSSVVDNHSDLNVILSTVEPVTGILGESTTAASTVAVDLV